MTSRPWPKSLTGKPTRQTRHRGKKRPKTPSCTMKTPAGWCPRHLPGKTLQNPAPLPVPGRCRVVPGGCRMGYPATILPMSMGINPSLKGGCRVCRVDFRGGV